MSLELWAPVTLTVPVEDTRGSSIARRHLSWPQKAEGGRGRGAGLPHSPAWRCKYRGPLYFPITSSSIPTHVRVEPSISLSRTPLPEWSRNWVTLLLHLAGRRLGKTGGPPAAALLAATWGRCGTSPMLPLASAFLQYPGSRSAQVGRLSLSLISNYSPSSPSGLQRLEGFRGGHLFCWHQSCPRAPQSSTAEPTAKPEAPPS